MAEKAEGNPLFAEEIVSFVSERGIVRTSTGKLDFDAAALPASVQNLSRRAWTASLQVTVHSCKRPR